MKKQTFLATMATGLMLLGFVFLSSSCSKDDDSPAAQDNTLVGVATGAGLSSLVSTVNAAGLTATLQSAGPFTVFAPTNAAFTTAAIPSGTPQSTLQSVLLYHVIDGDVVASAVPTALTGIKSKNAQGDSIYVKRIGSDVFVNGQKVTTANADASNGTAHIIGRVLMPPMGKNVVQLAASITGGVNSFDSLVKAVTVASAGTAAGSPDNIAEILTNIRGATVFAPLNQAFTDLLMQLGVSDINQIPVATLRTVLKHHVVTSRVFSNEVASGNVGMANGTNAVLTVSGGTVTIKGSGVSSATASVVGTDVMSTNAVVHVINKVILP